MSLTLREYRNSTLLNRYLNRMLKLNICIFVVFFQSFKRYFCSITLFSFEVNTMTAFIRPRCLMVFVLFVYIIYRIVPILTP